MADPEDPRDPHDLGPLQRRGGLEAIIPGHSRLVSVGRYLHRLMLSTLRVCRIEFVGSGGVGTGFLVGPDVVMTNYHVIESISRGDVSPTDVRLRFDCISSDEFAVGEEPAGKIHLLHGQWHLLSSPYSTQDIVSPPSADPPLNELDYAFVRLAERAGEDRVSLEGGREVPRGWICYREPMHDFESDRSIAILQHAGGDPMQFASDPSSYIESNRLGTRIKYVTATSPGSSGSPIFNLSWDFVGIHHAGDPLYKEKGLARFNQGIPTKALLENLRNCGKSQLLERMQLLLASDVRRDVLTDVQRRALQQDVLTLNARDPGFEALLASHRLDLARYRSSQAAIEDVAMALVRTAERGGWLELFADLVGERIRALNLGPRAYAEASPPPAAATGAAAIGPWDRVLLRGDHVMFNRDQLRKHLKDLDRRDDQQGAGIVVVRDPAGASRDAKTGKTHTIQLISAVSSGDAGFRPAFVNLTDLPAGARPIDLACAIADALRCDDRLAAFLAEAANAARDGNGAGDEQLARWNKRFCNALADALEAARMEPGRPVKDDWLIINSLNLVALRPETLRLIKALADKIGLGWPRFRLLLLGFDEPESNLPCALTRVEEIEPVTSEDLAKFFWVAYLQKGVPATPAQVVGALRRLCAVTSPTDPDFLVVAPRLVNQELAQGPSE